MKKFLKISGITLVALVAAIVIIAQFAPDRPGISLEHTSGGKTVVIYASAITTDETDGGTKITFGDHVVTVEGDVFKLDGKELDFGSGDRIEIVLYEDGTLSVR